MKDYVYEKLCENMSQNIYNNLLNKAQRWSYAWERKRLTTAQFERIIRNIQKGIPCMGFDDVLEVSCVCNKEQARALLEMMAREYVQVMMNPNCEAWYDDVVKIKYQFVKKRYEDYFFENTLDVISKVASSSC